MYAKFNAKPRPAPHQDKTKTVTRPRSTMKSLPSPEQVHDQDQDQYLGQDQTMISIRTKVYNKTIISTRAGQRPRTGYGPRPNHDQYWEQGED